MQIYNGFFLFALFTTGSGVGHCQESDDELCATGVVEFSLLHTKATSIQLLPITAAIRISSFVLVSVSCLWQNNNNEGGREDIKKTIRRALSPTTILRAGVRGRKVSPLLEKRRYYDQTLPLPQAWASPSLHERDQLSHLEFTKPSCNFTQEGGERARILPGLQPVHRLYVTLSYLVTNNVLCQRCKASSRLPSRK